MKAASNTAREQILRDLQIKQEFKYSHIPHESVQSNAEYFVQPNSGSLITWFSDTLHALSGTCIVSDSEEQALQEIRSILGSHTAYCTQTELAQTLTKAAIQTNSDELFAETAEFSITTCDALSARTASVIISSQTLHGRKAISAPETHIVLAYETQLRVDLPEAFALIPRETLPSQITTITGPSRTADIEKTLVLGAHGPKNLVVVIVKNA